MADLVVGLAKSVVEGALTKAHAAIEEEAKLRQSAQRNLVFITDEFQMMHSFLQVANAERVENPVVMTWVRQIRELAYDVEDCIEFVVHLDKKNRWYLRMIPFSWFMSKVTPLDQAVSDIEQLKARVEDVSSRNNRYSLISDTGSKPVVVQQQQELLPGAAVAATRFNMLAEARGATKRQQCFGDLTRLITKDKSLQVVSVSSGSGDDDHAAAAAATTTTTYIIRMTFNDPEICQNFTLRSWVILMHPFSPEDVVKSMLAQFYQSTTSNQQATLGMNALHNIGTGTTQADILKEFERLVSEETYLVVLEGLTSMADWDAIRRFLPDRMKGSWIIVVPPTTQTPEIATSSWRVGYSIDLDDVDLTQLITKKDDDLQVISVWGAGGDHGAIPIIRKTYNHPGICQNFTYRAWVKLMHPFSPPNFIRSMMAQFYANPASKQQQQQQQQAASIGMDVLTKMDAAQEDLFKEFERLVTEEMYLVVLEGLTNMVDLDTIRTFLPDTKKGSWIIVSTQQPEIATMCVGHSYQISELKKFSDDHSICALFKASEDDVGKGKKPVVIKGSQGDGDEGKKKKNISSLFGPMSRMNELGKYPAKARANSPPVMSVWGIAGVGKTAIVKDLLKNMHEKKQFDKYYWVDVSHPFNIRDLYMSLLSDFHSEKDPIEECHHLLKNNRCLIVIDDILSTKEWDMMQSALVCKHPKSVIIVITTEASIAKHCTNNEDLVFNVKALEASAATDLFKKQALKKNQLKFQDVEPVEVQELILKCGGIPKVIAAIAGFLATKDKSVDSVRSLNRKFMHHLETDPDYDSLQDLLGWLHSYFRTCPDSLKPCIFYLSIFPRDHILRRRRLIRRWIAEGYSRDNNVESAEENGEKHFAQLLELSIIQQLSSQSSSTTSEVRMVLCQVNGFIREYIVSRQMEENLVFELGDKCAITTQRTGRHLVILKNWDRDRIVFESIDFSRLRSLTVFGEWESFFISEGMKMLRVLDLEDATALKDGDLDRMVDLLRRLKFLSLRGHSEIKHLPKSLKHMRQLQTLDVRDTSIVTLPKSITKLQKLQYIRSGTDVLAVTTTSSFRHRRLVGVEGPRRFGKLTALHTLGVVSIGVSGARTKLNELKKLTQLRKLGVSGISMKNREEFGESVHGANLESLSVQIDKDNETCLDDISMPWVNLRSLKLYGLGYKLPKSIEQLRKLTKLDLEMVELMQTEIKLLARLPELCILRLAVMQRSIHFYLEMVGIQEKSYEKVKILEIACSSSSLHVTFGSKAMCNLELLKIDCSSALYRLSGLNYLTQLKEVTLKGTHDETLRKGLENQLTAHPKTPGVKLEELPSSS